MKSPQDWAREWSLPGIGGLVEAIRAEFAREAGVKLREYGLTYGGKSDFRQVVNACIDIVEALARTVHGPDCPCVYNQPVVIPALARPVQEPRKLAASTEGLATGINAMENESPLPCAKCGHDAEIELHP